MVAFLTWLTILYAVVLVVVLAVTLVIVFATLWGIGSTLGRIATALNAVERQTAPLGTHVESLNDGLGIVSRRLRSAGDHLAGADAGLATAMGEEEGAARPAVAA